MSQTSHARRVATARVGSTALLLGDVACGGGRRTPPQTAAAARPGPITIDVVARRRAAARRAVVAAGRADALPVRGDLSAGHRIREDRSRRSRLARAGGRRRSRPSRRRNWSPSGPKRNRSCRPPRRSWRGAQAKADADRSTYEKLKAASATPGVVAGNDVLVAEKAAEASAESGRGGQQNVEAARQALERDPRHGGLPASHGALRRRGDRTQRASRRAGRARRRIRAATPMLRLVENSRLRLVGPGARGLHRGDDDAARRSRSRWPRTRARRGPGTVARIAQAVDVTTRTMAVELDVANKDGRLAPGTFCQVRWPVRRTEPVAVRAERQRGSDDGSHVRHSGSRRQGRMGGRQDRPDVWAAGRSLRRSRSWR